MRKPHARPHQAILWALTSWHLRENYLPLREPKSETPFGFDLTYTIVLVTVLELARMIELSLKANLARQLRKRYGSSWWQALPPPVQNSAAARHRWTLLQLGSHRAGSIHKIDWLSFGDIAKTLRILSPEDWQTCLAAETRRRQGFERCLSRVKIFRDRELAHPKPTPTTNPRIRHFSVAVQTIPHILCPAEWTRALDLLNVVASLPPDQQEGLADDVNFHLLAKRLRIRRWLACPILEPPESCSHISLLSREEVLWRETLLSLCVHLDAGRRVFFTYGEPLPTRTAGCA